MVEWFWLGINGIVGIPLALIALVFVREGLRTGVALAFGFRVFEIRGGVGPVLVERTIGPVGWSIARWPIAGATLARSGVPNRHRVARAACAITPLAAQFLWLAFRSADSALLADAMREGPAVLAALDLANALLLALHSIVAIEFRDGTPSDVRLLLDAALSPTDSDRIARASYYARLARHLLERAKVGQAADALERGLVQLGREPMLVACLERFEQNDLASVIDQGECADDLRELIEDAEPKRAHARERWTLGERLCQSAASALPALFLVLVVSIAQADRIALGIESSLRKRAERVAAQNDPEACTAQAARWQEWISRSNRWFPLEAGLRSDRHASLAELERCRGDLAAAAGHQGEAMLAANAARHLPASAILNEPERWLQSELRMAELLRQAAAVESERRSFRRALETLGKAERRLGGLRSRVSIWPDPEARLEAGTTIDAEEREVLALRERVLAALSGP